MVKVQKQHKARPTSSHLPQSPSPSCATVPGKVNTLSACQKWEFILLPRQFLHLALFSVSPSLFFWSPPSLCCHIWNPAPHLFMWSVLFLSFFSSFLTYLKVLYLVLLAVSLHLMRSAITSHHNWSLCNYMLHHRVPPLL